MHRKPHISPTHEMYLKVLHGLGKDHEVARVRDVAQGLGVSAGTVSSVLKKLQAMELVRHDRYGAVALTSAGSAIARCVQHRFETVKSVLIEIFGVDPETADSDACMMEHSVSPTTLNRMEAALAASPSHAVEPAPHDPANRCAECEAQGFCRAVGEAEPLN